MNKYFYIFIDAQSEILFFHIILIISIKRQWHM